ncbi:MAG: transcriptional regulator domain-containing protein [Nitrospinales bacterium]
MKKKKTIKAKKKTVEEKKKVVKTKKKSIKQQKKKIPPKTKNTKALKVKEEIQAYEEEESLAHLFGPFANWEIPKEYPDPKNTEPVQWAWEFLRRNPEYHNDYKTYIDEIAHYRNGTVEQDKLLKRDTELREKWKVVEMQAPTIAKLPLADYPYFSLPGHRDFEISLKFNWSLPTAPQIDRARKDLECLYRLYIDACIAEKKNGAYELHREGFLNDDQLANILKSRSALIHKGRRFHWELLPVYLRLLDGEQGGEKQDVMAVTIYPNLPLSQARFKIKDQLIAARKIRDEEYIYLP